MRRRLTAAILLACLAAAVPAIAGGAPRVHHLRHVSHTPLNPAPPAGPVPSDFFGIAPQTALTPADVFRMKAGGIGTVRLAVPWNAIQPTEDGGYNWVGVDAAIDVASQAGLRVLPFVYGTPSWLARKPTTLPIDTARQRAAWKAFLTAIVKRYGPGGDFWAEHGPGIPYVTIFDKPLPIRTWQLWNEANFFYFAFPVSPSRYARLVKLSAPAIKAVDPGAKVVLTGLFGKPNERGRRGMPAAQFLNAVYRSRGIKSFFDGVALHPYAPFTSNLMQLVEGIHRVTVKHRDRPGLYITEMGWGSQNNFKHDAFEQGPRGQVRQLRASYTYLIANRRRLNLKQIDWFTWKDVKGSCDFCDSTGLFHGGDRLPRQARLARLHRTDPRRAAVETLRTGPQRDFDSQGRPRFTGHVRGMRVRMVVALDDPNLIVTIHERRN